MELNHYLTVVRRWWWLLVLASLVGGATAYAASRLVTPTFRATATLLVVQQQDPGILGLADLQASERLANTFTELVTVRPVLEAAIERGELNLSPDELEERLTVASPPTTQLLEITAEASEGAAASYMANVVAEAFIEINDAAIGRTPGIVSVVEAAQPPDRPAEPNVVMNALLGAFLGALAAGALILLAEYLDDTVKTDEQVAALTGLRVIGHVGKMDRSDSAVRRLGPVAQPKSREAEAYRAIRTNLTYALAEEDRTPILLVTSPGPGEGKSTTIANLAAVISLTGSRVLLVDGDLRRPTMHRAFAVSNSVGLTNLLTMPVLDTTLAIQRTGHRDVFVVPSGPMPSNPSELLGSERMEHVLTLLGQQFDVVLLDSPPVLAVTDATILSSMASAAILVTQFGKTRTRDLSRAVQRLVVTGRPIIGVVMNRVAGPHADYYYDYYPEYQH